MSDCVDWAGSFYTAGYGCRWDSALKKQRGAHVMALEEKLGRPLLVGMEARHTCDRPPCVNQDHLLEGTRSDNMQDAIARDRFVNVQMGKTYCANGHEFTAENTGQNHYKDKHGVSRIGRYCRTCKHDAGQRRKKAS